MYTTRRCGRDRRGREDRGEPRRAAGAGRARVGVRSIPPSPRRSSARPSRTISTMRSPRPTSSSRPTRSPRSSRRTRPNPCRASSDLRLSRSSNRSRGVGMQVHFANVWQAIADEVGDRTALIHGDERVSWREYDEQAARLAQAFLELGLQPDSKVALYLYNGIEYVTAQYAAFKIRGVPVNVNYRYTDNELLYLLDNSDAEVLVLPHAASAIGWSGCSRRPRSSGRSSRSTTGDRTSTARCGGDDVLAAHSAAPRDRGPARRHLHALHRRHDRHAEGRDVHARRLPARARRLRRGDHRCWRAADERRGAARARRPARPSRRCGSRRARRCTAPACGWARWRRC